MPKKRISLWWNWLWNNITLNEAHIVRFINSVFSEINSVLSVAGVTPSTASTTETTQDAEATEEAEPTEEATEEAADDSASDQEAADKVAALIDQIYVQERNDNTDEHIKNIKTAREKRKAERAALGLNFYNHPENFATRSRAVYCILDSGERHDFKSILEAGK